MLVLPQIPQLDEIFLALVNNCLRDQKTSCEFFVVTRRAHCGRQHLAANMNLERLFDREIIRQIFQFAVAFSPDDFLRTDPAFFHVKRIWSMLA